MPPELPSGTVTVLFTDIEDSTPLFHALGERMVEVIDQHNRLIMDALTPHGGVEVKKEGDALFVGFADPVRAVAGCIEAQRALLAHTWPAGRQVRVRMGLHVGPVHTVGHDYVGITVAEAARVSQAAHGSQILLSQAMVDAIGTSWPSGATVADLGEHALKGFPELRRLYEVRHPDLPTGFPPPKTLTATAHNLPAPPTPIIGREAEVETARDLLLSDARIVTLTGPGGIGKTRAAVEVARAVLAYVRGGAWLVELAPVTDPDDILPHIARTLGVTERGPGELIDAVLARLSGEPVLLVLDNFEQVVEGATLVAELVARAPTLTVLVTSRERLRIRGEHELVLEPLALPADDDAVATSSSGRLFLDRARAADATFSFDAEAAAAVAAVCRRCHGIPLAIELAAARVRTMAVGDLAARLGRTIDLLSEGDRDLPERHRALHATIAWSYDALDAAEQQTFRVLSVFAGGASHDAAQAIAGPDALTAAAALAERSMLVSSAQRIAMLEPLRRFALDRLEEANERASQERAHARWFAAFAVRADDGVTGPEQARWLDALDREIDNLRAALASGSVDVDTRLSIAAALGRFWEIRGYWTEGRAWLDAVLATDGGAEPIRGRALVGAGTLALAQGDLSDAQDLLTAALQLARGADDALLEGHALNQLGATARARGDHAGALDLFDWALTCMRRSGDERGVLLAAVNLASKRLEAGEFEQAQPLLEDARERARALGDARLLARVSQNLGYLSSERGDISAARDALGDALTAHRTNRDRRGIASVLTNLGVLEHKAGRDGSASTAWEEALHEARSIGDRNLVAQLLINLANLDREPARSFDRYDEAAALMAELGDPWRAAPILRYAAQEIAAHDTERAARAFARAVQLSTDAGDPAELAQTLAAWGLAAIDDDGTARVEAALAIARELDDDDLLAKITDRLNTT